MAEATTVLTAVAAVLVAAYFWSRYRHGYWQKRGVPVPSGRLPFLGHMLTLLLGRKPFTKYLYDMALEHRDKGYCGIYDWNHPNLLVYDPEMVKQILIKDFSSFHDRGLPSSDRDPLSQHLLNLTGPKWRNLRNRMSPTFTSGKLKLMFPLMRDIGDQLSTTVASEAKEAGGEVDIQQLLTRYVTDVIGSVAFGMNCNCLANEKAEFLTVSRDVFRNTFGQTVRFLLETIHPKLGELLPLKFLFGKMHRFFMDLMKDTVEFREKNKVERNDFVHLMMQLRDQDLAVTDPENHLEMTPGLMAAQAFIFFVAGLDSVSNTVAYCLHQMVQDQELQQRVADEVRGVIQKHDGQLTYQALKEMDLLNRVLMEGFRLWSPIGTLIRKCNKTTMIGDLVVEKDTPLMVVAEIMNRNPDIFPDPLRFDPERHTAEAKEQRHPYAFLPFGEGPRICIAERFALLEMKLALAVMLRDFKFSRGPKFEVEPARDVASFLPKPLNGFPMVVKVRE